MASIQQQINLYLPEFETLAGIGIFNPEDHVPPPRLAEPPALSDADIHRTPNTPKADAGAIRQAITAATAAAKDGKATLGAAFGLARRVPGIVPIVAFLGACLATFAVFLLAKRPGTSVPGRGRSANQ